LAKTTAPLLSFGAAGQIGDTMVYSKWKGRAYARRKVVPANPQTSEQTLTRNAFGFLQATYKTAPTLLQDVWKAYAQGKVLTDRNAYTKFNLPLLRDSGSLDDWVASPGALGGLPPDSAVSTPGVGTLSIAIAAPSVLPSGWTVYSAIAAIIREQDPDTGILYTISAVEDLTSAYVCAFSSLGAHEWQYRAWLKWNRPDGSFAYSPAIGGQSTST